MNDELHGRNQELQRVNADVLNLLDAVEIPILMLDEERRIRRFTQRAATFMGLTPADVGRRITDVALPILAPDLEQWIARAMEEAILVEAEVQDRCRSLAPAADQAPPRPRRHAPTAPSSRWWTSTSSGTRSSIAQWARDYARSIVEAVQVPLVVLDAALRVLSANAAYYGLFREKPAETEGQRLLRARRRGVEHGGAAAGPWPASLGAAGSFQGLEVEREFPGAGRRVTSVSGCAVASPAGEPMVLLAIEDVTERRQDEQQPRRAAGARRGVPSSGLRGPIRPRTSSWPTSPTSCAPRSPRSSSTPSRCSGTTSTRRGVARAAASIEVNTRRQARLVEDLLDVSRITAGKLDLDARGGGLAEPGAGGRRLDPAGRRGEVRPARWPPSTAESPHCLGDPARLQQVVANLLDNAVKFTPSNGRVNVRIDAVDGFARLVVSDTGRGIDQAFLPHVFERFAREGSATSHQPGLGLGLAIAHDLVELHGGSVTAESPGRDLGATFTVMLPRKVVPAAGAPGT